MKNVIESDSSPACVKVWLKAAKKIDYHYQEQVREKVPGGSIVDATDRESGTGGATGNVIVR